MKDFTLLIVILLRNIGFSRSLHPPPGMASMMALSSLSSTAVSAFSKRRTSSAVTISAATQPSHNFNSLRRNPNFLSTTKPSLLHLRYSRDTHIPVATSCSSNKTETETIAQLKAEIDLAFQQYTLTEMLIHDIPIIARRIFKYIITPLILMHLLAPVATLIHTRWEGEIQLLVLYTKLMLYRCCFYKIFTDHQHIPKPIRLLFDPYLRGFHYVFDKIVPKRTEEEKRQMAEKFPDPPRYNEYGEYNLIYTLGALILLGLLVWKYSFWNNVGVLCFVIWVRFFVWGNWMEVFS